MDKPAAKTTHAYLKAGRTIRLELPKAVGADAPKLDDELQTLLNGNAPDETVALSIRKLLEGDNRTKRLFEDLYTTYVTGQGGPVGAQEYNCPTGQDCVWFRVGVGTPIPKCPTHHVPLIPVP